MKKNHIYLAIIIASVLIFANIEVIEAKDPDILEKGIKISFDGIIIGTDGSKPYISNKTGSIMLPIRKINENLGNEVAWLDHSREVNLKIERGNDIKSIILQLDKNTYFLENDLHIMNTYFEVVGERSFAPIDFFEKTLNVNIDYHQSTGFIIINTLNRESFSLNFAEDKIDDRDRQLWDNTIKHYLADDLWTEINAYDAGHFLMVPMHAAFKYNEREWIDQFADHFGKFVNEYNINRENMVEGRLNKLHYLYLASQFVVLCEKTNNRDLLPSNLVNIINDEIYSIWEKEPAWQWARKPFEGGMRERLKWKLETKDVDRSYY